VTREYQLLVTVRIQGIEPQTTPPLREVAEVVADLVHADGDRQLEVDVVGVTWRDYPDAATIPESKARFHALATRRP